jgi:hypothetical protein
MRVLSIAAGIGILSFFMATSGIQSNPVDHPISQISPQADDQTCEQNLPDNYKQQISGTIDGDEMVLTVSARFGGAVESITWRGKEFINIFDHGRQISYAWQMNGHGECLNPTEPGSASDLFSPSSTSELVEVCRPEGNLLTTKVHPAFWLAPGEQGYCDGGTTEAVNDTLVSDQTMDKTIEIGYGGIENVIAFTAEITTLEDYRTLFLEAPTGYMTYEFTNYWRINPATGEMEKPESQPLVEPWSFVNEDTLPPILATEDGAYAMGAYSPEDVLIYEILKYDVPNSADRTNKWNIIIHEVPAPAGTYTYQSFVIVGTLEQVAAAMQQLYLLHPTDFTPPEGYVDAADCDVIDGWAWDPKTPDEPIEVEVRLVNEDGSETPVLRATASNFRPDLVTALGDNGEHGYRIDTADILHTGEQQTFRVYALNSNADLPARALTPQEMTLECPQFSPPPTEASEGAAVDAATHTPAGSEPEPASPALPCASGMVLPVISGVLLKKRRKEDR